MAYLIGTDEAGYGPNLGPLVISATVWQLPDNLPGDDLYRLVRKVISPSPGCWPRRLAMADSKQLYSSGQSLELLERGVLSALSLLAPCPGSWRALWQQLDPDCCGTLDNLPWHLDYDTSLPLAADAEHISRSAGKVRKELASLGIRLVCVRSVAVFPEQFNQLTEALGSKGSALSRLSLELVDKMLGLLDDGAVTVYCDKHGGRDRYGSLLQQQFPDWLVEVHREGEAESMYRFGPAERRVQISFRVKGERFLPAALASMASKYLREAAMQAFNAYWLRHVPDLRPTAGYPGDARRFKRAIEPMQLALGIDDRILWRNR